MTAKKPPAKKKATEPTTDDIMNRKKGHRRFVDIQTDGSIALEIEEASAELIRARARDRQEGKSAGMNQPADKHEKIASAALEKLTKKSQRSIVRFWFKGMGRVAYDKLAMEHPPTDEQRKQGFDTNLETFAPALVAASSDQPKISPEQAQEMWDSPDWSPAETEKLYRAARSANLETPDIPLSGTGIGQILNIG